MHLNLYTLHQGFLCLQMGLSDLILLFSESYMPSMRFLYNLTRKHLALNPISFISLSGLSLAYGSFFLWCIIYHQSKWGAAGFGLCILMSMGWVVRHTGTAHGLCCPLDNLLKKLDHMADIILSGCFLHSLRAFLVWIIWLVPWTHYFSISRACRS